VDFTITTSIMVHCFITCGFEYLKICECRKFPNVKGNVALCYDMVLAIKRIYIQKKVRDNVICNILYNKCSITL